MTHPTPGAQAANPSDIFIRSLLMPWLADATPAQINHLRDRFQAYRTSHQRVRDATVALISLEDFAKRQFNQHLARYLPLGTRVEQLEWRVVKPSIPSVSLPGWTVLEPDYRREPALLRLMQNFPADTSYFQGTGLVRAGAFDLIAADTNALIATCRAEDVGARYQQLLIQVFTEPTCALLAEDKRAGFLLSAEIARLKGHLAPAAHAALQALVDGSAQACADCLRGTAVRVSLLGQLLADVLAIELHDAQGQIQGVVLYMPSDSTQAFRAFTGWSDLSAALLADLQPQDDHQAFAQLIALDERAAFMTRLGQRLKDDVPDLELQAQALSGDPFATLVAAQVERIKRDARLLLVPSALVDATAASRRREQWKSAGLALAGLAGFFVPVVGAVLLGQLVVQVLSEAFEGVQDWSYGHQHEALEHFLGVAEVVAVTAAVAGGASLVARGFARSSLVDGLQPVTLDSGAKRLWSADPSAYQIPPPEARLQADGLYGDGKRRWLRVNQAWYEVQASGGGSWRLRHPQRPQTYGPIVESNGERGWRLHLSYPMSWHDEGRMLAALWPSDPLLDTAQARQILRIAGMDSDELRGLIVENRPLPVNLLDTVQRFESRGRIDRFFAALAGQHPLTDPQIQAWCLQQPGIGRLQGTQMRNAVLARQAAWRRPLFEHLSTLQWPGDALRTLLQRDFPGLPDAYAEEAIREVGEVERRVALLEQRIPCALARKARSLRQLARLSRAVEGLVYDQHYNNDSADLAIALLRRLPHWPSALNIEVREGSVWGRRVSILDPQGEAQNLRIFVQAADRFQVYDYQGQALELDIAEPQGLFEALVALLTPQQMTALGLPAEQASMPLRDQLVRQLPESVSRRLQLLGWRLEAPWFNPGQRLPDGRVGYLLSGRGHPSTSRRALHHRIRALFPGLSEHGVNQYLLLLESTESPYEALLEQENSYQRLHSRLSEWETDARQATVRHGRQQLGQRLRRCWRMIGQFEPSPDGLGMEMRLDLSGIGVLELPELPPRLEFDHVSVLILRNMHLQAIPVSFLRAFSQLRRLNLGSNHFTSIPPGLAYLLRLRTLNLDHNRIRLDAIGEGILSGLPQLSSLNLSHNPLGTFRMRFNHLWRLSWISLRYCHLRAWPVGLDLCGLLEIADLRNNQLSSIPDSILQMPLAYRRALLVDHNALSAEQVQALFSLRAHDRVHAGVQGVPAEGLSPGAARTEWLSRGGVDDRNERAERWDALSAMADSTGLFELFGQLQRTADYRRSPGHLSQQVWSMIAALSHDADLREAIFSRANDPLTCADSVAERFSDLQVQVLESQANAHATTDTSRGARLITLGRRLWRLNQVEAFARQDMQRRIAEERGVDEVEVSLYYRINLAAALDLPFQPTSMHYATIANVTAQQLDDALQFVRSAETREALAESLTERTFWQNYLLAEHERAFTELQAAYDEEGTELDAQVDSLSSEAYRQRWDELSVRRNSALQALRLQLTLDAIDTLDTSTPETSTPAQ
ncbi:DUF6543 domain-containing protein [Pseudomonas sp. RP23018S]|uniref:NEL-type E3 ubiquitin ligase domain-containing protein n=1 Tax=Pseudomonas sp. RP23018S TaxID=3096037 RepID=UPI002ACA9A16|nr:NEL-type E3 ubiquitin ligase domain-containing protein [Pseudomonas sp. RP23018S]MDZ5601929.1 DUF6543 domain-containing protein [Pseudomonas sp. RP23018S]